MKKLLVSQSIYDNKERKELGDMLDGRVIKFVRAANYLPIPVSNFYISPADKNLDTHCLQSFLEQVDTAGLILTGGSDIGQNENRDLTEKVLLDWSIEKKLPALGLCRGMQLMGTHGGACLEEVPNHIREYHKINGDIVDYVNSYHRFAFKKLPENYKILAKSVDGIVEALENRANRWQGWMWHPEREEIFRALDIKRLQGIFG